MNMSHSEEIWPELMWDRASYQLVKMVTFKKMRDDSLANLQKRQAELSTQPAHASLSLVQTKPTVIDSNRERSEIPGASSGEV